ncbi:hypothetical protein BDF20DRAFT_1646 [Mycotypha africana]|uniref:uncharacterized protein n=1 Tax=Mycotypha africana TaxID=64632 RepID=UPI0023004AD1|nr:uncharacterized protein BDF20DRAFT_1646 [Mycotypha africana]KAI8990777.1 hypothetical protein BDF20DRAFT_1646 [Mycotypha africana]
MSEAKNVLNSPFILKWPTIHTETGQTILNQLLKSLEIVGHYRKACREKKQLKKKNTIGTKTTATDNEENLSKLPLSTEEQIQEPDLNKRIHIGINTVARFLESYMKEDRGAKNKAKSSTPVIFICKREIKPLQLCQHLLTMAALAKVKLVPMPADSEVKISQILGLKRACVILMEIMEDKEEALRLSTNDIPYIEAPWLSNALLASDPVKYRTENTIRTIETTAPTVKKGKQQQPKKQHQQQQQQSLKRRIEDGDQAKVDNAKKIKS